MASLWQPWHHWFFFPSWIEKHRKHNMQEHLGVELHHLLNILTVSEKHRVSLSSLFLFPSITVLCRNLSSENQFHSTPVMCLRPPQGKQRHDVIPQCDCCTFTWYSSTERENRMCPWRGMEHRRCGDDVCYLYFLELAQEKVLIHR